MSQQNKLFFNRNLHVVLAEGDFTMKLHSKDAYSNDFYVMDLDGGVDDGIIQANGRSDLIKRFAEYAGVSEDQAREAIALAQENWDRARNEVFAGICMTFERARQRRG